MIPFGKAKSTVLPLGISQLNLIYKIYLNIDIYGDGSRNLTEGRQHTQKSLSKIFQDDTILLNLHSSETVMLNNFSSVSSITPTPLSLPLSTVLALLRVSLAAHFTSTRLLIPYSLCFYLLFSFQMSKLFIT